MATRDTGTDHLLADLDAGVLTLTLNRPEVRNAFSLPLLEALGTQLARATHDADVRCIVVTGAGNGFCAGGDVKGMAAAQAGAQALTIDERIHLQRSNTLATVGALYRCPKPTLAALPGAAAGAGLGLALACDLRIMSRSAVLTTAFAKVGFSGDYGTSWFLTRLLGAARAREMLFLSDRVDADEALRLGLANRICDAADLPARARELAQRLAHGPSVAHRYMKENLNRAATGSFEDCLDVEVTNHVHCGQTEDHRDAVRAFVDKREPVFKGR